MGSLDPEEPEGGLLKYSAFIKLHILWASETGTCHVGAYRMLDEIASFLLSYLACVKEMSRRMSRRRCCYTANLLHQEQMQRRLDLSHGAAPAYVCQETGKALHLGICACPLKWPEVLEKALLELVYMGQKKSWMRMRMMMIGELEC